MPKKEETKEEIKETSSKTTKKTVSKPEGFKKIAVADVQKVVMQSKQVHALKAEQDKRIYELNQWLAMVKNDVEKQPTQEEKQRLVDTYNKEFAQRQAQIKSEYAANLQVVEKSISETISAEAQKMGYDMVLSKYIVLFGGDDITEDIAKIVE